MPLKRDSIGQDMTFSKPIFTTMLFNVIQVKIFCRSLGRHTLVKSVVVLSWLEREVSECCPTIGLNSLVLNFLAISPSSSSTVSARKVFGVLEVTAVTDREGGSFSFRMAGSSL